MADTTAPGNQAVTVTEIAKLAGVGASAVSNWRTRHTDFPLPLDAGAGVDLFALADVLEWLGAHGRSQKNVSRSIDSALWMASEALRGSMDVENSALLTMQLIYLRQRANRNETAPIPELARFWARVPQRGTILDGFQDAVDALSLGNSLLRRVLALPSGVREEHLRRVVDVFANVKDDSIEWGPIATGLLRCYQDVLGMRGAFFATPASVTHMIVALVEPVRGVVYDPACGLGMVLADAWRNRAADDVMLVGQEVNEYNWRLGYLHLAINEAPFELATGDTLRDDRFRSLRADRVVLDPPLGQKAADVDQLFDERWVYGIPRSSSEWHWAQQLIFHLGESGVGAMTVLPAALFRGGQEAKVRQAIVESDMLDVVIELPPGLLAGSGVSLALLVFARERVGRQGHVLFIDGRQLGNPRRGRGREFADTEVRRVSRVVTAWRTGTFTQEMRFAASASIKHIVAQGANLSPSRYVGYEAQEITSIEGEPIGARVDRLLVELCASDAGASARKVRDGTNEFSVSEADSWPMARIGDLLAEEPRTGMRQETEKAGPEVPYIHTRMVSAGSGHLDELPSEVTRGATRGRLVERDDLLLVSRGIDANGRIGCATVRFEGEAAYSESLMRLRLDRSRAEPDYLRMYLTSRQGRATLAAVTTGSVIANLRGESLQEVRVPLPPLAVQRQIVVSMGRVEQGVAELSRVLNRSNDLLDALREGVAAGIYAPARAGEV